MEGEIMENGKYVQANFGKSGEYQCRIENYCANSGKGSSEAQGNRFF